MSVRATTTVLHGGREYEAGETLPVDEAHGKRLVERGLAEAARAPRKKRAAK